VRFGQVKKIGTRQVMQLNSMKKKEKTKKEKLEEINRGIRDITTDKKNRRKIKWDLHQVIRCLSLRRSLRKIIMKQFHIIDDTCDPLNDCVMD
jgi:hypothetical protein